MMETKLEKLAFTLVGLLGLVVVLADLIFWRPG